MADRLVWIDCEMTGLDLAHDALIEIAVLVTDGALCVLGDGVDLVIRPPAGAVEQMEDVVREMHTKSGLLDRLAGGVDLADAQGQVLAYVRAHVPEAGKAPLAGNSVGTDRAFLARDMPELDAWLHYRIVDVSSVKELVRRWFPKVYHLAPEKTGNHRALGDIRDSIDELRYYRETVFVPAPGPDGATARAAAERIRPGSTAATGGGAGGAEGPEAAAPGGAGGDDGTRAGGRPAGSGAGTVSAGTAPAGAAAGGRPAGSGVGTASVDTAAGSAAAAG